MLGELHSVYCNDFGENPLRHNVIALYIYIYGKWSIQYIGHDNSSVVIKISDTATYDDFVTEAGISGMDK